MTTDLPAPTKNQIRPCLNCGIESPLSAEPPVHPVVKALQKLEAPVKKLSPEEVANALLKILIQEKTDPQLRRLGRENINGPSWMYSLLRQDKRCALFSALPLDRIKLQKEVEGSEDQQRNFALIGEAAQKYVNQHPEIQKILRTGLATYANNLSPAERRDLRARLQHPDFTLHYQNPKESLSKTK